MRLFLVSVTIWVGVFGTIFGANTGYLHDIIVAKAKADGELIGEAKYIWKLSPEQLSEENI